MNMIHAKPNGFFLKKGLVQIYSCLISTFFQEIPIPPDSSSVQIGYEPDEIIEHSNLDENGNGPPQHIADEIRDETEQDIIPYSGRLEEVGIIIFHFVLRGGRNLEALLT